MSFAAVMAGGEGRRFGSEKGLALFRGEPMVVWAVRAARGAASSVVIIANKPDLYLGFDCPVYRDLIPGMGPLSGLHTAFESTGAERMLALACDMPLASPRMAAYIVARMNDIDREAALPVVGGKEQGLFAVYKRKAIEKHMKDIRSGSIQFNQFRAGLDKLLILEDELRRVEPGLESFTNFNRREELDRYEKRPEISVVDK